MRRLSSGTGPTDSLKDRAKVKANISDPNPLGGPSPPAPLPVGPQGPTGVSQDGLVTVNWRGVYSDDIEYQLSLTHI